jgi:hypothetical protein
VFTANAGGAAAIRASVQGQGSLRIGRARIFDNPVGGSSTQTSFSLVGNAALKLDNLLVADGGTGVSVFLADSATFLGGHVTIADHTSTGLSLNDASTSTPRLESSILWNNGASGSNDLDASGFPAPTLDRVLIGEMGDPNPGFVDPANHVYDLGPLSPAADQGDAAFVTVGKFDARHGRRVIGTAPDLGALERDSLFAWDAEEGDTRNWSQQTPSSF